MSVVYKQKEIWYLTFYDNISFFTSLGKKMENTFY